MTGTTAPPQKGADDGAALPLVRLVDDDASVLRALSRILAAAGHDCRRYPSAEEFLAGDEAERPGCAILDLRLPGTSGLDLQARLAGTLPVIFLTGAGDIATGVRAMKGGAVDFLTKPVEAAALLAAVEEALARDRRARAERASTAGTDRLLGRLTPREAEVMRHVVAGMLNKQIAAELGVAEKTVKVHRGRVMHKLGVRSLAELVRFVTRR